MDFEISSECTDLGSAAAVSDAVGGGHLTSLSFSGWWVLCWLTGLVAPLRPSALSSMRDCAGPERSGRRRRRHDAAVSPPSTATTFLASTGSGTGSGTGTSGQGILNGALRLASLSCLLSAAPTRAHWHVLEKASIACSTVLPWSAGPREAVRLTQARERLAETRRSRKSLRDGRLGVRGGAAGGGYGWGVEDGETLDATEAGRGSGEDTVHVNDVDRGFDGMGSGMNGVEGVGAWGQTLQPQDLKRYGPSARHWALRLP